MANDGKSAEGYIQDALKLLECKKKFTFLRLYDSHSAGIGKGGGFIPPQPADYVFLMEGRCFLLEVKSSETHDSLVDTTLRNVFSENQMLGVRLWERARGGALCAFFSLRTQEFEIWDSRDIRKAYMSEPRNRKLKAKALATGIERNEAELSSALIGATNDYSW